MPNFYELLNVPSSAGLEEIKNSYKQLILQCHPDKLQQLDDPNPGPPTAGDFNAINAAWNTLKDATRRRHYDAQLLQSKFQTHSNIFARVALAEMEPFRGDDGSPESEGYAYNCRCGGHYLFEAADESPSADEVIVECSECSLVIVVTTPAKT
ncbi:hypothetical protein KR018_007054 [Drosophila ironensis]|nr:hypothetical protein KR018_007054 [Drosophila ironensis]